MFRKQGERPFRTRLLQPRSLQPRFPHLFSDHSFELSLGDVASVLYFNYSVPPTNEGESPPDPEVGRVPSPVSPALPPDYVKKGLGIRVFGAPKG